MRKYFFKMFVAFIALSISTTDVSAQGFLKKLKKTAESVGITEKSSDKEVATTADGLSAEPGDSSSLNLKKALLEESPKFSVSKVIKLDANNDTIKNEDGTIKYYYHVVNLATGEVCDANAAQKIVGQRTKVFGVILKKVGKGALTGAVGGLLAGGDAKSALVGAGGGAVVGILSAFSTGDFNQIRKLNKELKATKEMLENFQQTFTEEGLPRDAEIDLSKGEFADCEVITKPDATIVAELEKSVQDGDKLDADTDELLKSLGA